MKKKRKQLFQNFGRSYLGIGWHNLLQTWYVDSPSLGATQQYVWFNLGKRSQSYIGVKITFFVFWSIYSQCGATASWAAQHTTVHLDYALLQQLVSVNFINHLCTVTMPDYYTLVNMRR